jgi:tetratricopeptide (TPR) repeat protein
MAAQCTPNRGRIAPEADAGLLFGYSFGEASPMWTRGVIALRIALCLAAAAAGADPVYAIPAGEARTQSFKLQSDGMRLYKEGNYRAATEAFQQVVNLHLNSFLAYYYLGASLIAERRYAEAIEPLKVALDLQPDYIQANLALGTAYLKLGDSGEARAEFLRVLDTQPNFAAAHDGLGQMFESIGQDDLAEKQYREALSINIAYPDAYTHLGDLYLRKDRVDEAIDLFLKSISVKPDFSQGYIRLGSAFARLHLYDEAIAATRRSQSLSPNDPDPPVALARIYFDLGSYGRAESQIQAALSVDHDHPGAHLILADLKRAREEFPDAVEVLQGLHERGIEDAQMRRAVADALTAARADAARYAALRDAIGAAPAAAPPVVALARFLSGLGSHLRAAGLLLEAAALLDGERPGAAAVEPPPGGDTAPPGAAPAAVPGADGEAGPRPPGSSGTAQADGAFRLTAAGVRFEAAVELLAARRFAEAVKIFYGFNLDEALESFDRDLRAAARFNLAVARAALGLHEEAITTFNEYIAERPDDPQGYLYLGNALLRLDRIEEARAAYVAFLERSVGAPEAGLVRRLLKSLDDRPAAGGAPDAARGAGAKETGPGGRR